MTLSAETPEQIASDPAKADRRSLYASYATGFFSMGQAEFLTVVIPLWAILQGASPTQIGTLVGARSMLTFFLAIHGGALMNRLGTRRVLMFFSCVSATLALIYPLLPWFPAMVMLQILIGFASNMAWIGAQTVIGQITEGDPGKIGQFSFYARMGNVIAPLIMGLMWDVLGPTLSFFGVAAWACLMFLTVSQIHEPPVTDKTVRFSWRDVFPRLSDYTGAIGLIALPAVAFTLAISFLRHATNGVESSFLIVYLKDVGFAATTIGVLFSIAEVVNGCTSLLSGRAVKLMPIAWLMVVFTTLSVMLLMVTPLMGSVFLLLLLAQSLRRGCEGIVQPLMFSLQALAVPRNQQGSVVGLRVTNNRFSSIITPIAMGLIVEWFGLTKGFIVIGVILLVGCAAAALAVARYPSLQR